MTRSRSGAGEHLFECQFAWIVLRASGPSYGIVFVYSFLAPGPFVDFLDLVINRLVNIFDLACDEDRPIDAVLYRAKPTNHRGSCNQNGETGGEYEASVAPVTAHQEPAQPATVATRIAHNPLSLVNSRENRARNRLFACWIVGTTPPYLLNLAPQHTTSPRPGFPQHSESGTQCTHNWSVGGSTQTRRGR